MLMASVAAFETTALCLMWLLCMQASRKCMLRSCSLHAPEQGAAMWRAQSVMSSRAKAHCSSLARHAACIAAFYAASGLHFEVVSGNKIAFIILHGT